MAGSLLSSIEQRTGEVRTPSQSFVHALSGSHLGSWCMNSYRVRKTVGWSGGARISAMPAKCRDAYEYGRGVCHFCNSVVVAASEHNLPARGRQMGQSTGDRGGHDLGQWVDGPMLHACMPAFGRPAPAADLACTSRWQRASVLFPPNLHLPPGEHYSSAGAAEPSWAGTGGDQTGVDACSKSNDWMSSIQHVSKHLEHASSSTQPTRRLSHTKSRCHTSTSPALPDLASLAAPFGPRIGQRPKKQSRSDEPNRATAKKAVRRTGSSKT